MLERLKKIFGLEAAPPPQPPAPVSAPVPVKPPPSPPQPKTIWRLIDDNKPERVAEAIAANPALLNETKKFTISKDDLTLTPVQYAAHMGRKKVIAVLHKAGADIDSAGDKGFTPLHLAARFRNGADALEYLLAESKTSVDARTDAGVTPLIEAARQGNRSSVRALLARNANMEITAPHAMPAIVAAAAAGHTDLVEELLKAGAAIDAKNNAGRTALWYAAYNNQPRLATSLLAQGADTGIADAHGTTLLMGAARNGNIDLAKDLLEAGQDINRRDGNGCTALHYTCFAEAGLRVKQVAEFLISKGAYIDTVDKQGDTPLDRAQRIKSVWQAAMTDLFQTKMADPASARDPSYLAPFTEGSEQRVTTMKALKFRPPANEPTF
ncbi:MAG: ankyrin repeat domain-containing protein [Alphaproteobacteria bacterium]